MATIKQIYVNHETAIIDEGCAIGEGTKSGTFLTLCQTVRLEKIVKSDKML